ncbi:trichohyalin isoform X1 [Frankliniella occidentalis]|uniref:Trichohyalin isoform X1 n=2 Tax=Frankliniella occidentalis TaxID=133901 RepID=A0A6J1S7S0_FRAOC|nr:trichohyalin isoform X1 [Frankliniella occidentalis]
MSALLDQLITSVLAMDPGVSLFSGEPEPLHINDNSQNQREEEEEALEDQRRRDQELKKLLTDAFDDLMDDEDDDDQSTVSSLQQNSFRGYSLSNTGSSGSNHQSPHYAGHDNHGQQHSSASPAQPEAFKNGTHRSPITTQPLYDNNMESFATNQDVSQFESDLINKNSHIGYSNGVANIMHLNSKQNADHFGYLSSIPQADFTTNESLYASNGYASNGHPTNGHVSNGHVSDLHAHNGYTFNGSHPNEDIYRQTDLHSQDQLMVLYATRMQEISHLNKELDSLRYERDTEVEQLKRKLLLVEAEKQGAFLSHKEAQNLLSDYQTQISQLRQDVEDLRLKNLALEKSREEITRERDVAKTSAADLIQKVSILERNGKGLTSEKHIESFLKTLQQQHDTKVRELQTQLESLTHKFSQKDHECCILERKLRDAQRAQEALITEKGKVVNELNKELEDAQKKVLEYTTSVNSQETAQLKMELDQVKAECKALERKLSETSSKLESAEKDLRQYEAVSKMGLLHNGDSSFDTDSITNLGISRRHSLGGRTDTMDTNRDTSRKSKSQRERDDLNMQLRDELQRALQGQRSKREEIRRLQGELAQRDQKIKTMKEQEKVYYEESKNFKKNLTAVLDRLKRQEDEAKALRGKSDEAGDLQSQIFKLKKEKEAVDRDLKDCRVKLERMKSENDSLREELADMELELEQAKVRQVDQTAAEFLAFHDESLARLRQDSSRQLEAQVVDYRVRMEQAQKECEEIKRLYIEVCSAKRALLTGLQEEQAQVKKLTSDIDDMKESQQSLEELHRQERDLNRRLRDELEKEKSSISTLKDERERQLEELVNQRLANLRKEHESNLHEMQKAKTEAVLQSEILQKRVDTLEKDSQKLQELETECIELRKQAIEAPKRQQAEVERISRELKQSRERVIQLEKSLRTEFQSQMGAMVAERDSIQAQLKQKDAQLEEYLQALSRIRPSTREIGVNTENASTLEALRKQFDERISELSTQFKANEEQRIMALRAEHKVDLASAEEHVKEETVKYFAEEISKMEDKHRSELGSFAKRLVDMESTFSKHLSALKNALLQKSQEVDDLNKKLQKMPERGISLNGNKGPEDSVQLRLHVEQLKEQIESDRNNMTEALSRWANEVKELQSRESLLENKIEELKSKYKHARKAAVHYKKQSEEKEKHLNNELTRLQAAYSSILGQVQDRFAGIVSGKEQEVVEQLKRIETYYEGQIKDLECKLKNGATLS